MPTDRRHPIYRRSPELVLAVLGLVYEADEPIPWLDLLGQLTTDRYPWKTVENTLYDLIAFGALHRIGKPGLTRTPDTRALKATPLGRAWLDRDLLDLPHHNNTEEHT